MKLMHNDDLIKKLKGKVAILNIAEYITYENTQLPKPYMASFKLGYEVAMNEAIAEIERYRLGPFLEDLDMLLKKHNLKYVKGETEDD